MQRAIVAAVVLALLPIPASASDARATDRERMVEAVQTMFNSMIGSLGGKAFDPRVFDALHRVPRHEFVPPHLSQLAYLNRPLSIGHGQTISQPFVVALMTDLLELKPSDRVLEIGTGSGYQAAVLSVLAGEVYSIEIVAELALRASETLMRLGYANVTTRTGDGYQGWEEHAPFDAILVTAAPDHVPPSLVAQLKPGGRLVVPVGQRFQELMLITKDASGATTSTSIIPVKFVPLTRPR
jgi:protein-L-isoaspartate(D-aspartate) O-methyltransferase